jgi:hypothetical protein
MGWSVVYSYTVLDALRLAFVMILRDFLLVGVVTATLLRLFANRVLLSPSAHAAPADSSVEWAYAFDVHTNSFFPVYLTLYLAQLILLLIITKDKWVCLLVGNTLHLAGPPTSSVPTTHGRFAQYIYSVYLGLCGEPILSPRWR